MAFSTGIFNPYNIGGARQSMSRYGGGIDRLLPQDVIREVQRAHDRPSDAFASTKGVDVAGGNVPPWQEILAQIMGGGQSGMSSQSLMQSVQSMPTPYGPILRDLRRQMGDVRAQESQNIADINSWFGQLGGMYRGAAKTARRSSKKAGKENAAFNAGLVAGLADPGVASRIASGAQSDARAISESGLAEANFNRRQAAGTQEQANYQRLIQQRLGMQEREDIRSQMAQVRGQAAGYRADLAKQLMEEQGDPTERLFDFIQLLPEDARLSFLTQGTIPGPEQEGGFDTDARSGLAAALGAVRENLFTENPEDERPDIAVRDFNAMLDAMKASALSGGFDLSDPQQLQAFRAWIAAHVLPQWNSIAASREGRMQYQPGPKGFYQSGR